ncbi:unnamed protein product [Diamesa tonsa]
MDLDTAKENIQPLKGGRNMERLGIAISALEQKELQENLENFEEAIKSYEGPDPLSVWIDYISWIEQSYPKHGNDSPLDQVVLKCIVKFEEDQRYKQDRRLIKLYIKYIDAQENPNEMYQELYSQGVGTMCADLYIAWSYFYDAQNVYKEVEAVFQKGFGACAQPYDELVQAHNSFSISMSRRMLYSDEQSKKQFLTTLEEKRNALTSLKIHKKMVGSLRTGDAVKSSNPGIINQENLPAGGNARVNNVYDDSGNVSIKFSTAFNASKLFFIEALSDVLYFQMPPSTSLHVNTSIVKTSIVDSARKRENTHEAGPWSKAKSGIGSKGNLFGKSGAQSEIGFEIMEDEEDTVDPIPYIVKTFHLGIQLPKTFVARNNPEKTKWNLPIFIQEPVIPNSIPMYDKFLLYPKPDIEISLEELKAYRWFKARSITAPITERYDHILSNTVESGIRIPPGFVSKNMNQTKFESTAEEPTKDEIDGFQVCFKKLYPEDKTELSLEELLAVKYKKGLIKLLKDDDFEDSLDNDMDETLIGNRRQSVYPLNRKSCVARKSILSRKSLMPPPEVPSEINDPELMPSPPIFEENESDVIKHTGAIGKSIFKRKMDELISLDDSSDGSSDLKNKCSLETPPRSSFGPFNHNESCSTQQFNFFIKQQSISTPISKKSAPKLIPLEHHSSPPSTLSPENFQTIPIPVTPFSSQTLQLKQLSTIMETTEITQFTKSSSSSVEPINSPENDGMKNSVGTLMSCGTGTKISPILEENKNVTNKSKIPETFSVFEDEPEAIIKSPKTKNISMTPQDAASRLAFSVFEDQSEASTLLPPQIDTSKLSEHFSAFKNQSKAEIEHLKVESALLPPQMATFKSSEPFSVFEDQPAEICVLPESETSIAEKTMLLPQIARIESPEAFAVYEDQPALLKRSQENSMILLPVMPIESPEAFSVFVDQPQAIIKSPKTKNISLTVASEPFVAFSVFEEQSKESALLLPKMDTPKSSKSFTVFEDQPEEKSMMPESTTNKSKEAFSNTSMDAKTMPWSKFASIESPEAFSIFVDQPELLGSPHDEISMMLPEMPIIESPEALIELKNSMIAFDFPEDVTETHHSIRELLIKKNNVPIYEDNQESATVAIPLPSVTKVGFSIFEDSMNVVQPKSAKIPLISENDETNLLHMSRKENVFVKPVPIQGAMDSFQIFEDKTETVPTMAFRSIKLIEKLQKKRTPSEDFFEIMMKSPARATNSKNMSAVNSSILKPEILNNDDLDHENINEVHSPSLPVLPEEKCPSTFDVDEENLNTEKFQFNLNSNTNSTLIQTNDINDSPTASGVEKAYSNIYDDLNLSIALNENEAALLKYHQPAFKIPEIPVKRPEKKKEEMIVDKIDDEDDDLSKSIYVTKPQPETHDYDEEKWLETDDNESSFVAAPNNQYEHTIIVPEASNKVRELIEADAGNPFNLQTREAMLEQCNFSSYIEEHIKTCTLLKKIPLLKVGNTLFCGNEEFTVQKAIGKGSFGAIFSGKCKRNGKIYAMKQEKPANLWEYYVIVELMSRLVNQNVVPGLMRIDYAIVANNASVLISEFSQYGSLIDVCNKVKAVTNKNMDEFVAMLLTTQILTIIDHLHGCRIIHADIKPDNFILINKIEYGSRVPAVQLIDFGCAIDMDWYQENETFNYVVETENFTCIEMIEKKPWTYQIDLYGLAGTTHVMLFGKYMEVQKRLLSWSIKQRVPRYFNKQLWDQFFHSLLNIPGCDLQPNLQALKTSFEEELEFKERYVHDKIQEFNLALSS